MQTSQNKKTFNNTATAKMHSTVQKPLLSGKMSDHQKFFYDEKMDEMSSIGNSAHNTRPVHSKKMSNHYEPTHFKTI